MNGGLSAIDRSQDGSPSPPTPSPFTHRLPRNLYGRQKERKKEGGGRNERNLLKEEDEFARSGFWGSSAGLRSPHIFINIIVSVSPLGCCSPFWPSSGLATPSAPSPSDSTVQFVVFLSLLLLHFCRCLTADVQTG